MVVTSQLPTERHPTREAPGDVLFNKLYGLRTVELNRPHKLNSLNTSMVRQIAPRLKVWPTSGQKSLPHFSRRQA